MLYQLTQWSKVLAIVSEMFRSLAAEGIDLRMVNLGGGFPARYRSEIGSLETYCDAVNRALKQHFGTDIPVVFIEPGRSLVGDAGVLQAEVVLVSKKAESDTKRWVYLDIGLFGGLAETLGESIKYRMKCICEDGASAETGPVVLAGPTCDSTDVLYQSANYEMPMNLKPGDKVQILSTGAYTTTYSSVNFNGFAPLKSVCI